MTQKMLGALLGALLILGFAGVAKAGTIDNTGNVFLAVGNGNVNEYTPNGTLVGTFNDGTTSAFTTGMVFDSSGNLYVTNFSNGTISQLDTTGAVANASFISGQSSPESIVLDKSGNFFVGDASLGQINEYNSSGTLIGTTTAARQNRGTDWIDLAANQTTMLYTSEGSAVKSVTVPGGSQNADFSNVGSVQYALRIIPSGADAGDVLVANSGNALLLDKNGNIIQTYTLPGNGGGDFALNIDPNGTSFWTADFSTGDVWEVNIGSGAIEQSWNSGTGTFTVFGLVVFGQQTAAIPTSEPGSLCLLLVGLVGAGLKKFRG